MALLGTERRLRCWQLGLGSRSSTDGDSDAGSWDSALVADDDATAAGAQPHRSGVQPPGPGDAAGVAELAAGVPAEAEEAQPRAGSIDGCS